MKIDSSGQFGASNGLQIHKYIIKLLLEVHICTSSKSLIIHSKTGLIQITRYLNI